MPGLVEGRRTAICTFRVSTQALIREVRIDRAVSTADPSILFIIHRLVAMAMSMVGFMVVVSIRIHDLDCASITFYMPALCVGAGSVEPAVGPVATVACPNYWVVDWHSEKGSYLSANRLAERV